MVNDCRFIGNLGADPELRHTQTGKQVCTFSIACEEKTKDKTYTEWVRVVTWGRLAEVCDKYLKKGKQVYIAGRLQTREYTDRDGNKRKISEIIAREMKVLGQRGDSGGRGEYDDSPY